MHPLETARLKVARAREHFHELEREAAAFVDTKPYFYVLRPNPEEQRWRMVARKMADPPLRLGLIAGDVAHNARSALDHVIYPLAALGPQGEAGRGERTQWPIYESPMAYKARAPHDLRGVRDIDRALIEGMQPYNLPPRHPLVALARLDDRDKHRVIDPVVASAGMGRLDIHHGEINDVRIPTERVDLHDGTEVVSFRVVSPEVAVDYTVEPFMEFAPFPLTHRKYFGVGQPFGHGSAVTVVTIGSFGVPLPDEE